MEKIPLTQGKFATVDDIDYEFLIKWKWYFHCYAVRNSHKSDGFDKLIKIFMHREILIRKLGHSDFQETDHKNHNKLDNRRGNLRPASRSQNQGNRKIQQGVSKFKGVHWYKDRKKWQAQIKFEGKRKHLGYFTDEIEAVEAYNRAAKKLFGEFAYLNPV